MVPLSRRRHAGVGRTVPDAFRWAWAQDCGPGPDVLADLSGRHVAELAANAARHGRVPGRGFRLTLTVTACGVLRIEVTDPRGEREPVRGGAVPQLGESGYGLLLVEEEADDCGVLPGPFPCKTVWAELRPCGLR